MISEAALRHLNVSDFNKDKVEVYFDIIGLLEVFASLSGGTQEFSDNA
jgi:hypothetical protein